MPTAVGTRDYQRSQVALRTIAYSDASLAWRLLDPQRLDASFPTFAAAVLHILAARRPLSVDLARDYVAVRREGVPGEPPVVEPPPLNVEAVLVALRRSSVISIKMAMTRGVPLSVASASALVRTLGTVDKFVGDGGREYIRASIAADPYARGWVRVTLGTCDFCREQAAGNHMHDGEANFPRHDHCGCQPEPRYDSGLKPEDEYVKKIRDLLDSGQLTEDQLRAMLADSATQPLTKVNIQTALDQVAAEQLAAEKEAARLLTRVSESGGFFTPEELQSFLDPANRRTAAAIRKELEATQAGRDLLASIKGFTETRGGVANLRTNILKTLNGTASDTVAARAQAFLDAMNTYPTDAVPELYRGIAVRVEENTAEWWDALEAQFQVGERISLNASSFSSSEKKAAEFARMIGGTKAANSNYTAVRFVLEDGSHALPVEQLSKFKSEKEWITGGDFKVVGYTPASPQQPYYRVVLRHIKPLGKK